MRRYRLFTKPAVVADVLQEDDEAGISDIWQEKAARLQQRRWRKVRTGRVFFKKTKPWRTGGVAWDL